MMADEAITAREIELFEQLRMALTCLEEIGNHVHVTFSDRGLGHGGVFVSCTEKSCLSTREIIGKLREGPRTADVKDFNWRRHIYQLCADRMLVVGPGPRDDELAIMEISDNQLEMTTLLGVLQEKFFVKIETVVPGDLKSPPRLIVRQRKHPIKK